VARLARRWRRAAHAARHKRAACAIARGHAASTCDAGPALLYKPAE